MGFYFNSCFFIFIFQRIYSFFIISMIVKRVDDCIRRIELDDGTNLYKRNNITCDYLSGNNLDYNIPIFEPIPYEIGQKIKIVIGDRSGICYLKMDIYINDNLLKSDDIKFWDCDKCINYGFNYSNNMLNCYPPGAGMTPNNYSFYFKINSLEYLDFNASEYFYYLNNTNYFYISSSDFDNAINLIDLYSLNNLYAKNSEGDISTPFYKYIYYKISFDEYKTHKGKFIGSDDSNNDLELDNNTYSRIFENKHLRYELSDEEKNNRGAYIRFKIGIYNNQKKLISELQDFNFFVCLRDYLSCDLENPKNCYCKVKELEINEDYLYEKSYIKIKIRGKGINQIFYGRTSSQYCTSFIPPNEVFINNIKKNYVYYEYDLKQEENDIILIWNNNINNLGCSFYNCENITFADLSHFDSSNVEAINSMFDGCKSLLYINFTNFETSNCKRMHWMFSKCSSLFSLDLSNFNTKLVDNVNGMFSGCKHLQYINLKDFELKDNLNYENIINGIPKNVIVCIYQEKASYLYQLIENLNCDNIYCLDDWLNHQKKLNKETNECIDDCSNKYEFNNKCYDICPHGTFYDEINSVEKCKCENEKCYSCPDVEQSKNLCIICNESFYPIENDPLNIGQYINCYKNPDGYYLDKSNENNYIYKLCYESCKTCEIKGDEINNNCIECNSEYPFRIQINNYLNCYNNCTYYYYTDKFGNYICTETNSCPV